MHRPTVTVLPPAISFISRKNLTHQYMSKCIGHNTCVLLFFFFKTSARSKFRYNEYLARVVIEVWAEVRAHFDLNCPLLLYFSHNRNVSRFF